MKNLAKYYIIFIVIGLSVSACTMGDKGSGKVPDSVSIDTTIKPSQPPVKSSDTTLIDSLQTDTLKKPAK